MKRFLRTAHRWLGLAMAAQIVAWMLSGLYFAWFPIETIRGEHLTRPAPPVTPEAARAAGLPDAVLAGLDEALGAGWRLEGVTLASFGGASAWRVSGTVGDQPFRRLVDADGRVRPPLGETAARLRAESSLAAPAPVHGLEWVEAVPRGDEYRSGPLPAWRVQVGGEEPFRLYLDAWTGEVTARRTARWQVFDFLWMLHILDFDTRDDFNTPWLQGAAFAGFLIALSGVVYWLLTTRLFRRRVPGRA